eukprot:Hpha_TRINITY_DN14027_c0_g1::TRINITY_DN14027_c0_g1_i1::g.43986::m.43986/K00787/FDPS; farnesyl diphosphate synthase
MPPKRPRRPLGALNSVSRPTTPGATPRRGRPKQAPPQGLGLSRSQGAGERAAREGGAADLLRRVAELERENAALRAATCFPATESYPKPPPLRFGAFDLGDKKSSFEAVGRALIEQVVGFCASAYELPQREQKWLEELQEYTVLGGKMNRGLMVVESGLACFRAKGLEVSNADVVRFAVLGWCVEWIQASFLVLDDIMDDSTTRRGQPCWFRREEVGLVAVNDGLFLMEIVQVMIKEHCRGQPYVHQVLDLFSHTVLQTVAGQLLDTISPTLPIEEFTEKRWELIVTYKTAFYSFYIPVALGMTVAGITEKSEYDAARKILVIMGVYFQAQDDYLDVFQPPEVLGKVGTDIHDKKCSWLFVKTFHRASPEQKALFHRLYGKCAAQSPEEDQIRQLFVALGMREKYSDYEQDAYEHIMSLKDTVKETPWEIFDIFLNKIFKRDK